ncbi:hypothetical protein Bequi_13370 [Brachybacterium sp. JHP9]|uniref:Uncharacterized protein n=1 Tax=Brachybacterium equifaecis TaxID=2910770 RepID=A0ABT0R3L1_9MICO|nr:hypothetical protein [Brachybacterium equifaecis]MCL6424355.1 hypothetical protein [Brachybacterium equifaecis]
MTISRHMFRNVSTTPDDPVSTWPHEVVRAAIEYGQITDWDPIAAEVRQQPFGAMATTLEETLEFVDPCGAATILRRVLERARREASAAAGER